MSSPRKLIRLTMAVVLLVSARPFAASPAPAPFSPDLDQPPIMKRTPDETREEARTSTDAARTTTDGATTETTPAGEAAASSEPASSEPAAVMAAPTVAVRSRLEPAGGKFHLGRPVYLVVDLTWAGEAGDVLPEAPEEPALMNLTKDAMVQSSRIMPDAVPQTVVYTYEYRLWPDGEGPASIEPIEIPYRVRGGADRLALRTDRHALTILPRRWPWLKILGGVAGAVALIALVGLAAVRVKNGRARRRQAPPPPASPFEPMRVELEEIARIAREGDYRDAYGGIERFVRRGLALRLGGDWRHATICEASERLADAQIDPETRDLAVAILNRCAEVKFAGQVPTVAAREQIVADCRRLLELLDVA